MTTIAAKEHPRGTVIASDSQATAQDKIELVAPKIFERNGVTYGVAGIISLANELRYSDLPAPTGDTDAWVNNTLCPALREIAKDLDLNRTDEGGYELGILAIIGQRIYEITDDLTWIRNTTGTYAIGSGYAFALGAMDMGATPREAIEVAATRDPNTGGKIHELTAQ